ncbi:hypothetical protein [Photobacterium leiognathi]|nr:hypothetical protein [Photobacterium leiognathi]
MENIDSSEFNHTHFEGENSEGRPFEMEILTDPEEDDALAD